MQSTSPANDTAPIVHPPGYRLRRGQNWIFLGLTYASYYLCRYNLDPVAPDVQRDLGLTNRDYGGIKTGRDGAYAVGQMVNGLITDRIGGKRAMTIGAITTVILNVLFGLAAWKFHGPGAWFSLGAAILPVLILIRTADGYFQAFGAPGFIKINTAWFRRKERGAFAGVFGAMINLGQIGAGQLAQVLATGVAIPLMFFTLTVPKLHWHYMFFVPPVVIIVVTIIMNLAVKNTPEEAGFSVQHDEEGDTSTDRFKLRDVFRKIASNRVVWFIAGAYFCTGFVRGSIASWWASYLLNVWGAGKETGLFTFFVWGLPITATLGSMASGYVSDWFFNGRRAPVAAVLYLGQIALTVVAMLMPQGAGGSPVATAIVVMGIAAFCNSTHSILGAAAPMDLGGRKMAGCAAGIIDSFQYYGSMLSGLGVGVLFDYLAKSGAMTTTQVATKGSIIAPINPMAWFGSMLPFGLMGAGLMTYLWIRHRGTSTVGT
ncbi:MAG: MFS transporter [Planctomycetes bacterium]|nr:MFS transporter [Planctomycetota bacterium]